MNQAGRFSLILLALAFVAQWVVPLSMIRGREQVLEKGIEVKFHVQPIDPYDPFRGRYVRINAQPAVDESVEWPDGLKRGQSVFAILNPNAEGFGQAHALVVERPEDGLYLEGKVLWPRSQNLDFGLDRYYMNEKMAPATEQLVADRLRDNATVYISTRILEGEPVITGLFVDGIPVEELSAGE